MSLPDVESQTEFFPPMPLPRADSMGLFALLRALKDNPLEAWTRSHFEELVVTRRLMFAEVHVVSDPSAVRRVLLDNADNYRKDSLQRRMLSAALGSGILTAEADEWRYQRRTLAPLFTPRAVRGFEPAMACAADRLVERWRRNRMGVLDIAAEVTDLTLEVLESTIFSDGFGCDRDEVHAAMKIYFDTIGRIDPFDLLGVPSFIPRISRLRQRLTLRFFDDSIDAIIRSRRSRRADTPGGGPTDILSLLLAARDPETGQGMSEALVRANVLTFIAAGHETTANAITWSLFLLAQSPEWRERVAAEAQREIGREVEGVTERLLETRAVVEEAMRLYPPSVAISRAAREPDDLAGTSIRRGGVVVIAPYVLHRHLLLWERPNMFDPSRFLGDARQRIGRYIYLPFGTGPRGCIGSTFALQQATLVVATIMKNFELELPIGVVVRPFHRVTLRPAGGMPMAIKCRS